VISIPKVRDTHRRSSDVAFFYGMTSVSCKKQSFFTQYKEASRCMQQFHCKPSVKQCVFNITGHRGHDVRLCLMQNVYGCNVLHLQLCTLNVEYPSGRAQPRYICNMKLCFSRLVEIRLKISAQIPAPT
jgi:hypothetical protein